MQIKCELHIRDLTDVMHDVSAWMMKQSPPMTNLLLLSDTHSLVNSCLIVMNDTKSTSDRLELRYVFRFSFFVRIAMALATRRQGMRSHPRRFTGAETISI
jgi:hypothetical protein